MARTAQTQQKFREFHRRHPFIGAKLREYALAVKRQGRGHFGIRQIWERLRWFLAFETADPYSPYKLNDHYTPFYARWLMEETPELAGFFEVRERRGTASTVHQVEAPEPPPPGTGVRTPPRPPVAPWPPPSAKGPPQRHAVTSHLKGQP